jgi:hypothetical protein
MLKTVLICYTQGAFDQLELDTIEPTEVASQTEWVAGSREIGAVAQNLSLALQSLNLDLEVEIIKVPMPDYNPLTISRTALAWRLLDLTESNGRSIDLAICLDFPAWSIAHPQKLCWILTPPFFVTRPQLAINQRSDENSNAIKTLGQAEKRGMHEAKRILVAQRSIAEELVRSGIQLEFNPLPPANAEPSEVAWQKTASHLLSKSK